MSNKKDTQQAKHFLNLSGEYGVCSELLKRGIDASVTLGNKKATDIIIIKDNRAYVVEVKTTNKNKIVTSFFQKYTTRDTTPHPDFWVFMFIDPATNLSEYYVLTHEEVAKEQMKVNQMTKWEAVKGGVDNIKLPQLEPYKNKWETIIKLTMDN